jgi:hypothetical protein
MFNELRNLATNIHAMWVITQKTLTINHKGFHNIHLLMMCQKPNKGSTSLNACDATLQKIKEYSHYYQFVMPLVVFIDCHNSIAHKHKRIQRVCNFLIGVI